VAGKVDPLCQDNNSFSLSCAFDFTAHFTHREHLDRSIMNTEIGHRERSVATPAVD
jgi:hypothetical protein